MTGNSGLLTLSFPGNPPAVRGTTFPGKDHWELRDEQGRILRAAGPGPDIRTRPLEIPGPVLLGLYRRRGPTGAWEKTDTLVLTPGAGEF